MDKTALLKDINKPVLILGAARSGLAAARLLHANGLSFIITDQKSAHQLKLNPADFPFPPSAWRLGEDALRLLSDARALVISPGVAMDNPIVLAARQLELPVLGELELASLFVIGPMWAVTGTNGKTTTVSLLGDMLAKAGRIPHVAGNIGHPLSQAVMEATDEDVIVAEVSSFQLETTQNFHPRIAAVLNLTPDHLNRHGDMAHYAALKRHIFQAMTGADTAILNADDGYCRDMAEGLKARVLFLSVSRQLEEGAFLRDQDVVIKLDGEERVLLQRDQLSLPGMHNVENALAAALIAAVGGLPLPVIRLSLTTFAGVEHRIEFTRELEGVSYFNDSKGTNPDSTIKAVAAMTRPTVIIMGGYDKKVSFDELAGVIAASPGIRHAVVLGQTKDQIADALTEQGFTPIVRAQGLDDAVDQARRLAEPGYNVLFSPACASFDMFDDYEQRGRAFKAAVKALKPRQP